LDPEELKERLFDGAVQCIVYTPLDEKTGEVDYEGLGNNIRFLVDNARGKKLVLTPCGSNSEFYALSDEEQRRVIQTVADEAKGKLLIVAGSGAAGTRLAVKRAKQAEEAGADGLLVVLPYYHVPNEDGMYQHYKAVAKAVDIGVQVYNNPFVSKCYVKPPLMDRITDIPGVVAVKECTDSVTMFAEQMKRAGKKVPILNSGVPLWVGTYLHSPGFISIVSNYAPRPELEVLDAILKSDMEQVKKYEERMRPLEEFYGKVAAAHGPECTYIGGPLQVMYIAVSKAAMNLMGLHGGTPMLPLVGLSKAEEKELHKILVQIGVKKAS